MKRIVLQGDSITDCWRTLEGVDPRIYGYGYPNLIAGELGLWFPGEYEVINRGSGGDQLGHVVARWERETIQLAPDMLSILVGVNDLMRDGESAVPRAVKLLEMILDWTREALPRCKIMLIEPFLEPCGDGKSDWAPAMQELQKAQLELAQKKNLVWLPMQSALDELAAAWHNPAAALWDGIHPTPAASRLIAERWFAAARKHGWLPEKTNSCYGDITLC